MRAGRGKRGRGKCAVLGSMVSLTASQEDVPMAVSGFGAALLACQSAVLLPDVLVPHEVAAHAQC